MHRNSDSSKQYHLESLCRASMTDKNLHTKGHNSLFAHLETNEFDQIVSNISTARTQG